MPAFFGDTDEDGPQQITNLPPPSRILLVSLHSIFRCDEMSAQGICYFSLPLFQRQNAVQPVAFASSCQSDTTEVSSVAMARGRRLR